MTDNWDETRRKTSGMGYRWDNSPGPFIYNQPFKSQDSLSVSSAFADSSRD